MIITSNEITVYDDQSWDRCSHWLQLDITAWLYTGKILIWLEYQWYDHSLVPSIDVKIQQEQTKWFIRKQESWKYNKLKLNYDNLLKKYNDIISKNDNDKDSLRKI